MPDQDRVLLGHGGGGVLTKRLVREVFLAAFDDPALEHMPDSAILEIEGGRMAFTTDAFVVRPLFFRGGDVGRLSICGTVNDLSVAGAVPKFISIAAIVEEGFPVADLKRVALSAANAAREAGVRVVTGDTKVVERGKADGLFLATAGVGFVPEGRDVAPDRVRPGDRVLVSGTMGDHGIAILAEREGMRFKTPVESDCAPVSGLVEALFASGAEVHAMRDPTRGGFAAALNELAEESGVTVEIEESAVPVGREVRGACEMLGLDPFAVANEGKVIAFVSPESAESALRAMRAHPLGANAAVVGRAVGKRERPVILRTRVGGERVLEMPLGESLPRIC